jgi:hypothetical protein
MGRLIGQSMDRAPSYSALGIAASLQVAAVLYLSGLRLLALWVAAVGVSILVWRWTQRRSKVFLVILNALLLSLPMPDLYSSRGASGTNTRSAPKDMGGITADDTFPGVILFPEVRQHAILVPPLPAMKHLFSAKNPNPLSIPFFGSYWVYKWPQRRLPRNAITMHGDPDDKRFQSTDGNPLSMEAHQNLGAFIETSCCSAIEVAIRNGDRYPGSVLVDLLLADSHMPAKAPVSLGPLPVLSTQPFHPGWRQEMVETLSFPLPLTPGIPRFDEFTVKFELSHSRGNHSPGIAIERFVLVPRVRL